MRRPNKYPNPYRYCPNCKRKGVRENNAYTIPPMWCRYCKAHWEAWKSWMEATKDKHMEVFL